MTCICITGASQSDLELVSDILQHAGMQLPKPAKRADTVDVAFWHEQVMAIAAEESDDVQPIANVGKLWEQLAGDIFVANARSKIWGWADSRSTWLLDFWLNFDPRLNLILVCVSAQQMLARAITAETEAVSVEAVMNVWQVHHQELLRVHHRNPQRSLLVDARECAENPRLFIEHCAAQWKRRLTVTDGVAAHREQDSLALYLALQLSRNYPQTAGLQHELAATITRLGAAEQVAKTTGPEPEQIIADYRALRDRSAELQQVEAARDEQSKLAVERQTQIDALTGERESQAQQHQDAQNQLKEAKQENELLLLQLHQVQEELETIFLKHQAQQKQVEALIEERDEQGRLAAERQAQIQALTQARDEQAKLAGERQAQIQALTQARDEQGRLAAERQAQIHALTLARDEQGRLAAERQAQIHALTLARDEQVRLVAERQAQQQDAQNKLKEAKRENELLLLQLHQVQEELEQQFLQHQDAQKALKTAEERWKRMLQRSPDYCDYESIEVLPAEGSDRTATTWRLKNLSAAGRSLPELEFKTIVEHGIAGLVFTRQPGTTGPLIRWPAIAANQSVLTLIPVGTNANVQERAETLFDLSTRDWDLLQSLTRLLGGALEDPATLNAAADFQSEALRNGLGKLGQIIEKFTATVRYDSVSLKREQVNSDYEHLWLALENIAFGGKRWPRFEFRLSCANLRPNHFGTHPKLEFPEESSKAPFEGWFVESYDDFGAKLELRFALPKSMDFDVWQRLSENDRAFLAALIKRLPAILGALQNAGVQIKRPWVDWVKMARDIQRAVALRTAASSLPTSAPPLQAAARETNASLPQAPKQPVESPPTVKSAAKRAANPVLKPKADRSARASKARRAR